MYLLQIPKAGSRVTVYYNPDKPEIAVLQPGYNKDCHRSYQIRIGIIVWIGIAYALFIMGTKWLFWEIELDSQETVSFEELLLNNTFAQEALINLLERKGILTKEEVIEEMKRVGRG